MFGKAYLFNIQLSNWAYSGQKEIDLRQQTNNYLSVALFCLDTW